MPNIGAALKQEVVRLSRREMNAALQTTKSASAQYRRDIASLKRQVIDLHRKVVSLRRLAGSDAGNTPAAAAAGTKVRFVAKGLVSQRERLGLSAAALGHLIGVSAQTVYNWEAGKAVPRAEPLRKIVALRSVTKRMVHDHLAKLADARKKTDRKD